MRAHRGGSLTEETGLTAERSQAVALSKHIFESCRSQFWVARARKVRSQKEKLRSKQARKWEVGRQSATGSDGACSASQAVTQFPQPPHADMVRDSDSEPQSGDSGSPVVEPIPSTDATRERRVARKSFTGASLFK